MFGRDGRMKAQAQDLPRLLPRCVLRVQLVLGWNRRLASFQFHAVLVRGDVLPHTRGHMLLTHLQPRLPSFSVLNSRGSGLRVPDPLDKKKRSSLKCIQYHRATKISGDRCIEQVKTTAVPILAQMPGLPTRPLKPGRKRGDSAVGRGRQDVEQGLQLRGTGGDVAPPEVGREGRSVRTCDGLSA